MKIMFSFKINIYFVFALCNVIIFGALLNLLFVQVYMYIHKYVFAASYEEFAGSSHGEKLPHAVLQV